MLPISSTECVYGVAADRQVKQMAQRSNRRGSNGLMNSKLIELEHTDGVCFNPPIAETRDTPSNSKTRKRQLYIETHPMESPESSIEEIKRVSTPGTSELDDCEIIPMNRFRSNVSKVSSNTITTVLEGHDGQVNSSLSDSFTSNGTMVRHMN